MVAQTRGDRRGKSRVGGGIEIGVHGPVGLLAEQALGPRCASGSRAPTRPAACGTRLRPARAGRRFRGGRPDRSPGRRPRRARRSRSALGPFQLAAWTPGTSRMIDSTSAGPARRAAIAPELPAPASFIKRPRSLESSARARCVEDSGGVKRDQLAEAMPAQRRSARSRGCASRRSIARQAAPTAG